MPIQKTSRNAKQKKKKKKRNGFLMKNTNERKTLNMKHTKPKTYKGEMSF